MKMTTKSFNTVYEGLLLRIFEQPAEGKERGMVVAFTSVHSGAGVSQITRALSSRLREEDDHLSVVIDSHDLDLSTGAVRFDPVKSADRLLTSERAAVEDKVGRVAPQDLVSTLESLRARHRYVLLDCPSLKEATHAVRLAPLVDGVVLVIEANRTQKQQVLYAERTIENARGKILGHVLNKRNYVVPNWFFRQMEAAGL
jgi:MinD-like ATPase involved in chromosome partitioning or flagellar assembly